VWDGTAWSQPCGAATACGPGPRDLVTAATAPGGVVLYGGQTNDGHGNRSIDGDAWIWNGRTWQTVCSTCPPGRRAGVAMAGNGTSVLLFGGGQVGATNSALGDTWQLRDGNWTRVGAGGAGQPAPRLGASMAWDGRQFVLFGGITPQPGNGAQVALSDTWTWSGHAWVRRCGTPMPPCGPPGRLLPGLAPIADPGQGLEGALLVGGLHFPPGSNGDVDILGDIWFWNGSTWLAEPSPWPSSSPVGESPPIGVPFVGALAARPASCQTTLAADFPAGSSSSPVVTAGTWTLAFDANHDGRPDACATATPMPGATTTSTSTPAPSPPSSAVPVTDPGPAQLPRTGGDPVPALVAAALALALGVALVASSFRRAQR
jgi:LPXTG-motif cell wall-anchored protein